MSQYRSGQLRCRIILQRRSPAPDGVGGQSVIWSGLATVWADIQPASGRKLLAAQAVQSEVTHTIICRYRADLFADPKTTAAMRALYGSRIFNLGPALDEDRRHKFVTIPANEGVNNG